MYHNRPCCETSVDLSALDHATATEMPCRQMCLVAAGDLFTYLPKYKANPKDEQVITRLQLAAFASLGFLALNVKGGLGLSHSLGYALGSPYGIPHVCVLPSGEIWTNVNFPTRELPRA